MQWLTGRSVSLSWGSTKAQDSDQGPAHCATALAPWALPPPQGQRWVASSYMPAREPDTGHLSEARDPLVGDGLATAPPCTPALGHKVPPAATEMGGPPLAEPNSKSIPVEDGERGAGRPTSNFRCSKHPCLCLSVLCRVVSEGLASTPSLA